MTIELAEHDGLFQPEGIPKLVIVVVDGKRFPYPAEKRLVDLFMDVMKIPPPVSGPVPPPTPAGAWQPPRGMKQRGDIVRALRTYPVEGQEPDVVEGREYRVLDIIKQNGVVVAYDLIDDAAPVPRRLTVAVADVVRVRMAEAKAEKQTPLEVMATCPCGEPLVLTIRDDRYVGTCAVCGRETVQHRAASERPA